MNSIAILNRNAARILRATRKARGWQQKRVAEMLGIDQADISRIEHGKQNISLIQWAQFCENLGVEYESVRSGFVDTFRPIRAIARAEESGFKVPADYAIDCGTTVRSLLPFLASYQRALGEKALTAHLRHLGFDEDFFVILDHQVSIRLILDLYQSLGDRGVPPARAVNAAAEAVRDAEHHGAMRFRYDPLYSASELIETLVGSLHYYEANFTYAVERQGPASLDIVATPADHIDRNLERRHPRMEGVICRYKAKYARNFQFYGGRQGQVAPAKEVACFFKGDGKCVFHVPLAN